MYERLTAILRDVFDDDSLAARPELSAADVAAWDSFGHLRLIFTIEREFGIDLAAAQVASFQNIGELAALLSEHERRVRGNP
jgi:acyl carrier protein